MSRESIHVGVFLHYCKKGLPVTVIFGLPVMVFFDLPVMGKPSVTGNMSNLPVIASDGHNLFGHH
jgi:hypothetical protein